MKRTQFIFEQDIEVPEIVLQKAEEAYQGIRKEQEDSRKALQKAKGGKRRRKHWFQTSAAAVIGFIIFGVGGISAAAMVLHHWGRGMQGNLQATDQQQEELVEKGIAVIYDEEDYSDLAVCSGGVTVIPEIVVADEKVIYLSFHVEGYHLPEGEEPFFESVDVYLGEARGNEPLNVCGSFYNGIITDIDGTCIYDDGTELTTDEYGSVERFTDENGELDYTITAMVTDYEQCLLGETMHVSFVNIGTAAKAEFFPDIDAEWNFEIKLPDEISGTRIPVGTLVDGTSLTVESVDLSPVSIQVNYSFTEDTERSPEDCVPAFSGVILKDGTRIPYMGEMGMRGTRETEAFALSSFDRVIDPEEVKSILLAVYTEEDTEEPVMIEIPIAE